MSEESPGKVLITGVHGQLGRALAKTCADRGIDFEGRDIDTLDIGSTGDTAAAITGLDAAINQVSAFRGNLGAVQNRLGSTINNLAVQVENLSAAESRIRDVDVAYETAMLTRNSILQQASVSILAQANAAPQAALALLG